MAARPKELNIPAGECRTLCACKSSILQYLCDGDTCEPGLDAIRISAPDGPKKIYLCRCKMSTKYPLCDGSHQPPKKP